MNNEKFNSLLNEKYFLLYDIAKKYNYSEELLDMMTFIYVSFYMDFGKDSDFPLYDLFNKIKIIYDCGTINEIALKNNFGTMPNGSVAVTIFKQNLNVFKDESLKQKPPTILLGNKVDKLFATPVLILEMLAHEIRHALMGYYNTNLLLDSNTYYIRSGLQEVYYSKNENLKEQFTIKKIGTILDEIFNTYITELLVNRIFSLKKYKIENDNLRLFLNSIKTSQSDGKYRTIGYNSEVKLLYPLLLDEMFVHLVNHHQFDGKISIVKSFIESNTDICDYQTLCNLLDDVYNGNRKYSLEVENKNIDFIRNHISNVNTVKSIVLDIKSKILIKK